MVMLSIAVKTHGLSHGLDVAGRDDGDTSAQLYHRGEPDIGIFRIHQNQIHIWALAETLSVFFCYRCSLLWINLCSLARLVRDFCVELWPPTCCDPWWTGVPSRVRTYIGATNRLLQYRRAAQRPRQLVGW